MKSSNGVIGLHLAALIVLGGGGNVVNAAPQDFNVTRATPSGSVNTEVEIISTLTPSIDSDSDGIAGGLAVDSVTSGGGFRASACHSIPFQMTPIGIGNTLSVSGNSISVHWRDWTCEPFSPPPPTLSTKSWGEFQAEIEFELDQPSLLSKIDWLTPLIVIGVSLDFTWRIEDSSGMVVYDHLSGPGIVRLLAGAYTMYADYSIGSQALPIGLTSPVTCADDCIVASLTPCEDLDIVLANECMKIANAIDEWGVIITLLGADCNDNGTVDTIDIASGVSNDLNADGIPDECQDCNGNIIPDPLEILFNPSLDCNLDTVLDECEIADSGTITGAGSHAGEVASILDLNQNGILDECEQFDCNGNVIFDIPETFNGLSVDCNQNYIPDECDIDPTDPDGDNLVSQDCDLNGLPDECEDCVADVDGDGMIGVTDFLAILANWGACPTPCTTCTINNPDTCPYDFSRDCEVNSVEFLAVLNMWGPCP